MKPILLLPKGIMSPEDIKLLRDNELCVVECDDPSKVKFVDPIPAVGARTEIEQAAIELSRKLLSNEPYNSNSEVGKAKVLRLYVEALIRGTRLDPMGTLQEQEERIISHERAAELRKIARDEARAEAAAKREAKKKAAAEAADKPASKLADKKS